MGRKYPIDPDAPAVPMPTNGRFVDLTGRRFGRLTVIRYLGKRSNQSDWLCKCDCGEDSFTRVLSQNLLRKLHTQSCGCLRDEKCGNQFRTHGLRKSPEYVIWCRMRERCCDKNNPAYKNYGGRGVRVCEEWQQSFEAFYRDMGPRPAADYELDRFPDNDGPYCKSNCRWTTRIQQARNRRNNRLITIDDETHCVSEWAEIMGIKGYVIRLRLRRGWTERDAVMSPPRVNQYV